MKANNDGGQKALMELMVTMDKNNVDFSTFSPQNQQKLQQIIG